jgi:hypothetical protein
MTTAPTTSHHEPTDRMRRTALAAGLLYIATFVFSIPAAFGLYDDVLNDAQFVFGAGSETGVLWGGLFEILTALAGIGTAVVLYPVIKKYGENAALGFAAARVLEASMIFLGVVCVMSVVTLRQDFAGTDAPGLGTDAQSLVAMKDWTFLLGPGFMASVNALCLAPIMYRSRLVPRLIPTLGIIGAPLLFASSVGTLFGLHEQVDGTAMLLVLPIFVWELSLGIWMAVKGFQPVTVTDDPVQAHRVPDLVGAGA